MLYDSTKSLLQGILAALETVDATGWDDQTESGNACLYEMHQMSKSLYTAYKPDRLNSTTLAQGTHPEKLARAIPHVRMMVIAIRHKDQAQAIQRGKAALAEMNGTTGLPVISSRRMEPTTESKDASVLQQDNKSTRKGRLPVRGRKAPRQMAASSGM